MSWWRTLHIGHTWAYKPTQRYSAFARGQDCPRRHFPASLLCDWFTLSRIIQFSGAISIFCPLALANFWWFCNSLVCSKLQNQIYRLLLINVKEEASYDRKTNRRMWSHSHTQMTETSTVTRVIVLSVNGLLVKTQLMSFSSNTPTSKSTTSAN